MIKKLYTQFTDLSLRQNFKSLAQVFGENPFLKGDWTFLPLTIPASGTNIKIPHSLGFKPLDVLVLSAIGGTYSFNYTLFDSNNIYVTATLTTASVPLTMRVFIGRYSEDSVNV